MSENNFYASGISDSKESNVKPEEKVTLKTGEKTFLTECPSEMLANREGMIYPEPEHFTYFSKTCGMERGANILLPVGCKEGKKYPVVYMLHGIFGDENSFTGDPNNGMKTIWTNMAADGLTKEVIVVFPNMFAKTKEEQTPGFSAEACLPYDNFVNDWAEDLMPYVEKNYPVLTGRENTALAGFSMGGRETLYISLLRPELMSCSCAVSPAPGLVPGKDKFMSHPGSLSEAEVSYSAEVEQPEILILCGTKDSVVGDFPKSYHELMEKNGISHYWYEVPDADHDNRTILSGIYNFMTEFFRK